MRFYSESLRRAAEALETDPDRGLTAQEAARRLAQYGENQLRQAKPPSLLLRCLGQLKDPMILVLLAAAACPSLPGAGRTGWTRPSFCSSWCSTP